MFYPDSCKTLILVILILFTCGFADKLLDDARRYFEPISDTVPAIKDNRVTKDKIDLGRMLYFDPRLSSSGIISCNTCHNLSISGDDNLPTSVVGHGWAKGPRVTHQRYTMRFSNILPSSLFSKGGRNG